MAICPEQTKISSRLVQILFYAIERLEPLLRGVLNIIPSVEDFLETTPFISTRRILAFQPNQYFISAKKFTIQRCILIFARSGNSEQGPSKMSMEIFFLSTAMAFNALFPSL
jgi:hypothetical protein